MLMPETKRWPMAVVALASVAAGAMLAAWSSAEAPAPVQSPMVAIVDVIAVMDSLDEAKDQDAKFQARAKTLEQQIKDGKAREQALKADVEALSKDDPTRKEKEMAYLLEAYTNQGKGRLLQELILDEGAEIRRSLYTKVVASIDTMAKKSGYDLVLLDDRKTPLSKEGPDERVVGSILQKKILFCGEPLDITKDVSQQMNNDWAAKRR